MKEFITSDWHFNHNNICGEDGFVDTRRHFKSVLEMNETIIANINNVVSNDDVIYHLGDIGMNIKPKDLYSLISRINGQIVLIKGNHDSKKILNHFKNKNYKLPNGKEKFIVHEVGTIVKRCGLSYYLTHYPLGIGENRAKIRSLCGHIHDTKASESNCLNVGIDSPEIDNSLRPFAEPLLLGKAMDLVDKKWLGGKNNE